MNRRSLHATAAAATLFSTLFVASAWLKPAPRFLWNASASTATGLYWIDADASPRVGDLVAIDPPPMLATYLAKRGYVLRGVPLLKRVAALPGARICRSGVFVTVDGVGVARALARDRAGRSLPIWIGCRLVAPREIFLLNAARDSLDGRYFGPVSAAGLLGTAHPILTRRHPAAPLRSRLAGSIGAHAITKKEKD
jgi:conjugative transfer signal peptidase TraF